MRVAILAFGAMAVTSCSSGPNNGANDAGSGPDPAMFGVFHRPDSKGAYNIEIGADGTYRFVIDLCDSFGSGTGSWTWDGQRIHLSSSSGSSATLRLADDGVRLISDGLFSSSEGELSWSPGGVCAVCNPPETDKEPCQSPFAKDAGP